MPASHAYPPYIEGIIFDATGKPAAGGTVEAYVAGSSVPAALWSTSNPATSLGPVVTIDGAGRAAFRLREGYAYKLRAKDKDGALIWERDNVKCPLDGGGVNIPNPMESTGDMIVGGVGGQPERLAPGNEGEVLKVVSGVPTWATDAEGMQNPMTEQGDMIVGAADGAPMRLAHPGGVGFLRAMVVGGIGKVLQWVGLNAGQHITITQDGAGATISADEQEGDHKAQVSATDSEPNYLQNKVLGGDLIQVEKEQTPDGEGGYTEDLRVHLDARGVTAGYVPTADGSNGSAWAAIPTQPGDHKILVTATDTDANYLASKLTPGSNITITTQTDGDGVQTLEISATGGGGGGGGSEDVLDWSLGSSAMCYNYSQPAQNYTYFQAFLTARKGTPKGIFIAGMNGFSWANTTVRVGLYNYDFNAAGTQLCYGQLSSTANPSGDVLFVPFSSTQEIALGKRLWLAFCLTARGNIRIPYVQVNENSFNRFKTTAMTSGDTLAVAGTNGTVQGYECGVYY